MATREAGVRRIALSLPETSEAPHHDMTSFRVAGKIFATVPPAGDRVHIFVDEEEIRAYCAEYLAAVEELWWAKNLRGCRVVLAQAQANQALLREMLTLAWRTKAPTALVRRLEAKGTR
jgi:hypothetical protein